MLVTVGVSGEESDMQCRCPKGGRPQGPKVEVRKGRMGRDINRWSESFTWGRGWKWAEASLAWAEGQNRFAYQVCWYHHLGEQCSSISETADGMSLSQHIPG